MPPFSSASKVIGSLLSRRNRIRHLVRLVENGGQSRTWHQLRCFSGIETPLVGRSRVGVFTLNPISYHASTVQRRRFLGCGDGEEGGVLSKIYEEKRVLGYSPEQLYNVVAAVDLYHDFLPWCQRSDILKQYPDGSFDAELEIGFKFFVESYVSHVELVKPKRIKTTASDTTLFDHLINIWEFNPGPVPGTCSVYFLVDFKFQSPLYRQVASMFFKDVVSRLVGSFNERCRVIYGPAARVLENSYEHGV
ncbi:uncharacterized protein LOC133803517 [Humulus lupulus]|uniref:uncharacterized protein LOC133803517 n=1 Tax=Humulus lupulus TaxID=3486 RepID=UPI002B40DA44|nr:uncharacterized protein LOC133803517 [Humulus lupulus]